MLDRANTLFIQLGAVAVVLAALPFKLFELDRYFVPKELILHAVALLSIVFLVVRGRNFIADRVDGLVALSVLWAIASALFATNHWLAQRSVGVAVSSAILFWATRKTATERSVRAVLTACALAGVVSAITCLAQAYGLDTEYFSTNRAPGGTFGNRNFIAHISVITLPAVIWTTVTARRSVVALLCSFGFAIVSAALVLSRSRAAWLAVMIAAVVLVVPMIASRKYWGENQVGGRFARLMLAGVVGAIIAVVIPNSLNWNSDSPYLDSARGMVDYKSGSGHGRIAQYENSLDMASSHPIFGVGPGNWPVQYVQYAPPDDPSLASDGMTANPWPSSDWVAFISERGFVAAAALAAAILILFFRSLRRWREVDGTDAVLSQLACAGTIITTMIVSTFDVALMLAAPAFIFWAIVGVTSGIRKPVETKDFTLSRKQWSVAVALAFILTVVSVLRSATEAHAMALVGRGGRTAGWVAGENWDPGSYRMNARIAEFYRRRGRCKTALDYARRAHGLFPHAREPRSIINTCD